MSTYIIRRLIEAAIVVLIVSVLIFLIMRLLPGDPLELYINKNQLEGITPDQIQALRVDFGLDKSLPMQYASWMVGMLHGDFGKSISYQTPVGLLMAERFPVTFYLGLLALIVSSILGILAGLVCALRRGGALDAIVTSVANFGISVPNFWLGILMIYFFGLALGWLPTQGFTSPFQDFWQSARQLIMPVFCLSVFPIAGNARQTRSSMLEIVRQDYIRTAWSKGLRERRIVLKHVLKNGLIPVVTLIGMQVRFLFSGSVLIETVFNVPGVGRLLVSSIFAQDYQIVQSICVILGAVVVLANLAVDISYGWFDPRVRFG
jgi:peptide/nickel transport system permease protein